MRSGSSPLGRTKIRGPLNARGWFSETVRVDALERAGIALPFVQDNQSFSAPQGGTVRGPHFQIPPQPQAKLVRVLAGAILDVAVVIRPASPTYWQCASMPKGASSCSSPTASPMGSAP